MWRTTCAVPDDQLDKYKYAEMCALTITAEFVAKVQYAFATCLQLPEFYASFCDRLPCFLLTTLVAFVIRTICVRGRGGCGLIILGLTTSLELLFYPVPVRWAFDTEFAELSVKSDLKH